MVVVRCDSAPGARLAVTVGHGQSQTVAVGAAQQQPVAVPRCHRFETCTGNLFLVECLFYRKLL
eukprot:scaffold72479_cov62-Phaeocystis_antarctica.AAC.1